MKAIQTTILATVVAFVLAMPAVAQKKALVGGTLIDGYGSHLVRNSVVLVDGERITAVGTQESVDIPEGYEVISTEGMTVLPGLWDMHVHLMITGHSDYGHWDKTYIDRLRNEIMPASAEQLLLAGSPPRATLVGRLRIHLMFGNGLRRVRLPGRGFMFPALHPEETLSRYRSLSLGRRWSAGCAFQG